MKEALKSAKQFLKNNYFGLIFLTINISLLWLHIFLGDGNDFFNFDREYNLPSAWASLQCVLAAGAWLLWHRSLKSDKIKSVSQSVFVYSGFLLLIYLAFDEFFQWHEFFGDSLGLYLKSLDWGIMFWRYNPVFAWLLIFAPFVILLGTFFARGAWRLWPRSVFWQVVFAGALFVFGSFGIEVLGALHFNEVWQIVPYWYLVTVEEFLELLSICFLLNIFYKQFQKAKLK